MMGNVTVYDSTTAQFLSITGNQISLNAITGSNYTFELTGLSWWNNPYVIGVELP